MHTIIVFKTNNTVTLWDHSMHLNCKTQTSLVMTEVH